MKRFLSLLACAVSLGLVVPVSTHAIAGIGIHYGLDFSLDMADKIGEKAVFNDLKLSTTDPLFTGITGLPTYISGAEIPVIIDRTNWQRKVLNLGGKVFIDIIPFLDAIELSTNFGLWEYQGRIRYPSSITVTGTPAFVPGQPLDNIVTVKYDTLKITPEGLGVGKIYGLSGTPYAKLHFDLTIRKYLLSLPPVVKILRIYGGGGASLHFATPAVSAQLIKDALGADPFAGVKNGFSDMNTQIFSNKVIMKKILDEITAQLITPHWGMHLVAGVSIKPPIFPIGLYVDGKYMIPFENIDKTADISGMGFLVNAGVALGF